MGKADITWNQSVVRLKSFWFCNITSLDVHEDMSVQDCGRLTVNNWNLNYEKFSQRY